MVRPRSTRSSAAPRNGARGGPPVRATWLGAVAAAAAAALYAPSLGFGLVWDDPDWLRRAMDGPWWRVFGGTATYQFYRPLTVLYSRIWANADGTVDAVAWHAAQVLWHALATWLVVVLAFRWTGRRRTAALAGLAFAAAPLAHQPVSWAAAHQPLSVVLTLVALTAWSTGRRERAADGKADVAGPAGEVAGGDDAWRVRPRPPRRPPPLRRSPAPLLRWPRRSEVLSVAAFAGALWTQESVVPVALAFPAIDALGLGGRRIRWPVHAVLAAAFVLVWHQARRLEAFVGGGYDGRSLVLLAQTLAWPVLGWLAPFAPDWMAADGATRAAVEAATAIVTASTVALGCAWLVRRRRGPLLAACAVWALPVLYTVWARLSWDYLRLGQRLVYPALAPVAIAYAVALDAALAGDRVRRRRIVGALVAASLALSIGAIGRLHAVSAIGAQYVAAASSRATRTTSRVLVNFPDRIALTRGPLPLGWWGQVVAPVSLDLAQFDDWRRTRPERPPAADGREVSCAVAATGQTARAALPLRWDLRGAPGDGAALATCAGSIAPADVFLAGLDGRRATLAHVGAVERRAAPLGEPRAGDAEAAAACRARDVDVGTVVVAARSLGLVVCIDPPAAMHGELRLSSRWVAAHGSPDAARAAAGLEAEAADAAAALLDVTPFVHFVAPDGSQGTADGDLWGGAVPLAALVGAAALALTDVRAAPAGPRHAGIDRVRFGLYRRTDGRRIRVTARRWDGARWRPWPATEDAVELPVAMAAYPATEHVRRGQQRANLGASAGKVDPVAAAR